MQLIALPLEHRVGGNDDLDVEVAGRAAVRADLALAGELDSRTGVDAGRDLDGEGAPGADPAVAGAFGARMRDGLAVALALRAGTGGHDLPEEGALHLLDLAAALAHRAGDGLAVRCRAGTGAGAAGRRGVDGDVAIRAEDGVLEIDLDADEGVLAPPGPGSGAALRAAAEEGIHDVAEVEPAAESAAGVARIAAHVVHLTLLGVAQDLVGGGDHLEPLLMLRVGVDVGMQLAGELAVRLLDLLGRGFARDAEQGVEIGGHGTHCSSRMRLTYCATACTAPIVPG